MKRAIILILIAGFATPAAFAAGSVETGYEVVATTSWTAAFAQAAGAESIHVLAPYDLRHPPEYELAPSDVQTVGSARYVVFAGYERMVERLKDAVGGEGPDLIQITTTYAMTDIRAGVTSIGEALGTREDAERSIDEIAEFYTSWRSELEEREIAGGAVICHAFQAPLARELGLEVAGTFGPAPLEAGQIAKLSEISVDFIIDNRHNDVGIPLRETMPDTPVVTFINFPGHEGTRTLLDVLRYNRRELDSLGL